MTTRATHRTPATPRRLLIGATCAGALLAGVAGAGAQDPAAVSASYEAVIAPAGVLATKAKEKPGPLQARAVRTLRASRALLGTLGATPGAYPACVDSLTRLASGSVRVSQGASLVRTRARLPRNARPARVRLGRGRIVAGIRGLEAGLAQAGVCRAQLNAQTAPPLPVPGSDGPGGIGPPILDFL